MTDEVISPLRRRMIEDKQSFRIACFDLVAAGLLDQGRLKTNDPTGFA
jgi:hypothetical protein